MEAYAIHKGAMISPLKARMTLDLVRGKDVQTAAGILKNTNTKASRLIIKVLDSAVANAVNNNGANEADLVISECYINPGTVYKRMHFGSRGHIDRRNKRTSHITIKVTDNKKQEVKEATVEKAPKKETKKVKEAK